MSPCDEKSTCSNSLALASFPNIWTFLFTFEPLFDKRAIGLRLKCLLLFISSVIYSNGKVLIATDTFILFLHILDLIEGYFAAHNTPSQQNFSKLTHCERPISEGDKPFLPCLLVTYGSGTIIAKVKHSAEEFQCLVC